MMSYISNMSSASNISTTFNMSKMSNMYSMSNMSNMSTITMSINSTKSRKGQMITLLQKGGRFEYKLQSYIGGRITRGGGPKSFWTDPLLLLMQFSS